MAISPTEFETLYRANAADILSYLRRRGAGETNKACLKFSLALVVSILFMAMMNGVLNLLRI